MRPILPFLAVLLAGSALAQPPSLREPDRIRLAEAFRLASDVQDCVWPGWSEAPFAVLLVTPEHEFLVRHPRPSDDFEVVVAYDSLLRSAVHARARQLDPGLLATFPAVGGVPTIVIGQPEATGRTSTAWVLTVLHEHLHQLQFSQPGYSAGTLALGLSGGDESGMWMLTYPFPYASEPVGERLGVYRDALIEALGALAGPDAEARLQAARTARAQLRAALSGADDRYLAFQVWQEGVARYIELRVAEAAAMQHVPLPAFAALPDAVPYAEAARTLRQDLAEDLAALDLETWGRSAFYPLGAAEALLLDGLRPGWQRGYIEAPFDLEPLFELRGPQGERTE